MTPLVLAGPAVRFTNKSKDIEKVSARLQEETKLQAELSDTEATVRWMKDGKELKASEKYEFQSAGKRRVLKIRHAAQEDAGVYECVCEGDKMLFQLSVRGKGLLCTLGVPALNQWSHQGSLEMSIDVQPRLCGPTAELGANTVTAANTAVLSLQLAS